MFDTWNPYNYPTRTAQVLKKIHAPHVKQLTAYFAEHQLTPASHHNIAFALKSFTNGRTRPLIKSTKEDALAWVQRLRDEGRQESTINTYLNRLKPFLTWMDAPPIFAWYHPPRNGHASRDRHARDKLVDPSHIRAVIDAATKPQTRALIAVLYDSAARISEILSLKWRNVDLTEYGARLRITGKTGERTIAIVKSAPYLKLWIEHHDEGGDPEAYVFYAMWKGRHHMTPGGVQSILNQLCDKTGIPRFSPHQLRHTRLTELAKKMPEQILKSYAGWTNASTMASVYVHLSGKDTERALLEVEGVQDKEALDPEPSPIEPVTCPICSTENPAGAHYCFKCSTPLSKEFAERVKSDNKKTDDIMERIRINPTAWALIVRAVEIVERSPSSDATT